MPNVVSHTMSDLTPGKVLFGILFVAALVLFILAELGIRG